LQGSSNPYNLKFDYGLSPFDRKSVLVLNFVYDLPFFNHASNKLTHSVLGGWQVSGIVTTETGLALTPTYNNTSLGMGGNTANRPDLTGSVSYPHTFANWFSAGAFSTPQALAWGNAPKGVVRGPGLNTLDASVFKNFGNIPWFTKEGANFQLRIESFNTLNHTEFSGVQLNYSSLSNFGSNHVGVSGPPTAVRRPLHLSDARTKKPRPQRPSRAGLLLYARGWRQPYPVG